MNERIFELAEQAWLADSVEIDPNYKKYVGTERVLKHLTGYNQKFAELIVKECAEISEQSQWSEAKGEYYEGFNEAMIYVSNKIKEHFGVE